MQHAFITGIFLWLKKKFFFETEDMTDINFGKALKA